MEGELLCFDLETTGVDRFSDVPVSLALLRLRGGVVFERTVALVDPGRPIPEEATAVHGITTDEARRNGLALHAATELVAGALVDASRRGVPVVGVKLDYDLTMVDVLCRALDGRGLPDRGWSGPVLDALVLDRHVDRYRKGRRTLVDLCELYGVTIDPGPQRRLRRRGGGGSAPVDGRALRGAVRGVTQRAASGTGRVPP